MRGWKFALISQLLLAPILCASATNPIAALAGSGSITGIVLDERGQPVAGAKVYVMEAHRAFQGAVRYYPTDDQGLFKIVDLPFGEYKVFAKKLEAGYADMGSAFYSDNVFPKAILSERNPTAYVIVQLPPKAGVLRGSVTDAVTQKPVNPVLTFRRVADPKNFLGAGALANFHILVPSDTPVTLEIRAHGYVPWHYPGQLRLKPGETMDLNVRLQPAP